MIPVITIIKKLSLTQKEIATNFLKLAGTGEATRAFELYVAQQFTHHNQYFKGDRSALLNAMSEAHKTSPNLSLDIKYVYVDNDSVIVHSHVVKSDMAIAVVHIFRFENDKIVEMWDVGQIILEDSPNENGLF